VPEGFIVFISGVPGVGKTTISYELLKACTDFRIIEETDLIREVLRGYNSFMKCEFGDEIQFLFDKIEIYDHMKFLSYGEAKQQCEYMKKSFEKIIARQQRKGIPSIINGVHIIPEVLDGILGNQNIVFVNLYIRNKCDMFQRFKERDPEKYTLGNMTIAHQTNIDLHSNTQKLAESKGNLFYNVDVTTSSVEDTVREVIACIKKRIGNKN